MPACTAPLPIDLCRSLFRYDPETGKVYRMYDLIRFPAGLECGAFQNDYVYVSYKGHRILLHRLAWALHYGEWPMLPLDHINCDRHDNRIANLRLSTLAENNRNRPKQSNNKAGYKGVCWHKGTRKFHARITLNKKTHSLGYFDTAEAASEAYERAVSSFHGEYGRTVGAPTASRLGKGPHRPKSALHAKGGRK